MREHMGIFRGKRKSDGIWVEGCLFIDDKKEKYEILVGYTNYRIAWEVDPDTIGECTGLTDKNGKLIFEGHTINSGGTLYEIRMDCGEWRMFDKAGYYCELYIYAEESEIVSED